MRICGAGRGRHKADCVNARRHSLANTAPTQASAAKLLCTLVAQAQVAISALPEQVEAAQAPLTITAHYPVLRIQERVVAAGACLACLDL